MLSALVQAELPAQALQAELPALLEGGTQVHKRSAVLMASRLMASWPLAAGLRPQATGQRPQPTAVACFCIS